MGSWHATGKEAGTRVTQASSSSVTTMPVPSRPVSEAACTFKPVRVVVRALRWTTVRSLTSGRPRQFLVMKQTMLDLVPLARTGRKVAHLP